MGFNSGADLAADAAGVYFLDSENKLNGVELVRGNKIWSSELGGEVISNLLVVDDAIFLATNSQSDGSSVSKTVVRSVSRHTGITSWHADVQPSALAWLGTSSGNIVVVGSNGSVTSLGRADGRLDWKTDLPGGVSAPPSFGANGMSVGTASNQILGISAGGKTRVIWKSASLPTAIFSDSNGRFLIGDDRGNLTSISGNGDKSWRFRNGAQISFALRYDSEYLATSHDNFFYKISKYGDVKWKRRLSGRVNESPLILGDSAVISTVGTGSVFIIDLKNGKILNRIDTRDETSARLAAVGSDSLGFVVGAPDFIYYFSAKCPAK